MKRPLALDLCCKAGGVSVGLHRAGFDVIGVDIEPQPRYPFPFIQADALAVPLDGYDFIWASPHCQGYTAMRHAPGAKGKPRQIARFRARMPANVLWAIENVEKAAWDMQRTDRGRRLKDELIAINALIEAHRDEFEATITTNEQRREWLEKKVANNARKATAPPPSRPPHSGL